MPKLATSAEAAVRCWLGDYDDLSVDRVHNDVRDIPRAVIEANWPDVVLRLVVRDELTATGGAWSRHGSMARFPFTRSTSA